MRGCIWVLSLLAGSTPAVASEIVVSVSSAANEIGRKTLAKGGNAVDAAVATGFALAVAWPEAGNIGGGGFMVIRPADGKSPPVVIDYREKAPASATADLFVKQPRSSHLTVGVPGSVAGLALAHERFGKLPWKSLVEPAVQLAREGIVVDAALAGSLNAALRRAKEFPELQRVFGKKEGTWKVGDRLVQPELADTLQRIAELGPAGFYQGKTAELLVEEMRRGGGLITEKDLAAYRAVVRQPLRGSYRGYEILVPPPPSSGGICLIEMLNMLENFDLQKHPRYSAETLHLLTEVMRRAYRDRAAYLGDADFVQIPAHLTTKEYAKKLAQSIDLRRATLSEAIAGEIKLADEKEHTTHYSILDASGLAVSTTTTLEDSFGSKVVVRGAGFLLNNQMTDFNPRPGVTTRTGQIGTEANLIAPGKRMLSSMTPTIVVKDGRAVLITGSPGGRTIINTTLNVLLNVIDFEMPLRQAVDAPRMHHQWFPDRVQLEAATWDKHGEAVAKLEAMGHRLLKVRAQGDAHSIWYNHKMGKYEGVQDYRRAGRPANYRD